MDDATFALSVFCVTVFLGVMSLGFQIYVSRRLRKEGKKIGQPVGKRSWIEPFVLGWQNAKAWEIVDVMVFWSFILVLLVIGMIATVLVFVSVTPSV